MRTVLIIFYAIAGPSVVLAIQMAQEAQAQELFETPVIPTPPMATPFDPPQESKFPIFQDDGSIILDKQRVWKPYPPLDPPPPPDSNTSPSPSPPASPSTPKNPASVTPKEGQEPPVPQPKVVEKVVVKTVTKYIHVPPKVVVKTKIVEVPKYLYVPIEKIRVVEKPVYPAPPPPDEPEKPQNVADKPKGGNDDDNNNKKPALASSAGLLGGFAFAFDLPWLLPVVAAAAILTRLRRKLSFWRKVKKGSPFS